MQESPFQSLLGLLCSVPRAISSLLGIRQIATTPHYRKLSTHNDEDNLGGDSIMSHFLRLQFPELCVPVYELPE